VLTAPARALHAGYAAATGTKDPTEGASGRKFLEDIAGIVGGEPTAQEFSEGMRAGAEEYPGATTAGRVVGEIAGGGALTKGAGLVGEALGAGRVGRAVAGATEGAGFGYAQAPEEAYVQDVPLTANQVLASVGLGAILGGAGGALLGGGKVSRLTHEPPPAVTLRGGPYRAPALAEDAEAVAGRVLGTEPAPGLGEKLAELWNEKAAPGYAKAAAARTGGDESVIRKALRWDDEGRSTRAMLRDSDAILQGATRDLTDDVGRTIAATRDVTDEVVRAPLKREHVAANIAEGAAPDALERARTFSTSLHADLDEALVAAEEVGGPDARMFTNYGRRSMRHLEELDAKIAKGDAADAYMAIDQMRRELLDRYHQVSRAAQGPVVNPFQTDAARLLAPRMEGVYRRAAEFLADEATWGAQGAAQKRANQAWVRYIKAKDSAFEHIATRTNRDIAGRWEYAADPAKISSRVKDIGRAAGALKDQQFREFVAASRDLTDSIAAGYKLPPDKAKALAALRDSSDRIGKTLEKAEKTVAVVNQFDELEKAQGRSGFEHLSILGGIAGGPLGAAAGAAWSAISNPASMIRTMVGVEGLARRVSRSVDRDIDGFFTHWTRTAAERGKSAIRKGRELGGKAAEKARQAALPASIAAFQGDHKTPRAAYDARSQELRQSLVGMGDVMQARLRDAVGEETASRTPQLTAAMAAQTAQAAAFLMTKLPAETQQRMLPHMSKPIVSDSEIAKFARYWTAVIDPRSVVTDFRRGIVTHEQIEALREVHAPLYADLKTRVISRIAELDEQKQSLPYQALLQLDRLLGLDGAGEPTMSTDFIVRYQDYLATADMIRAQNAEQGQPAQKPVTNLAAGAATPKQQREIQT
jgi:hypothetical protein